MSGPLDDEGLLRRLGAALDDGPAEPPPDRVLALRQEVAGGEGAGSHAPTGRRRELPARLRWVTPFVLGAAAAAAVAVGLVLASDDDAVPTEPVDVDVAVPGVGAEAELIAHTWGTEVHLVVAGLVDGQEYDVTVFDRRGREVGAGSFVGVADRPVDCNLNASVLREEVRSFRVVTTDGVEVLTSDVA